MARQSRKHKYNKKLKYSRKKRGGNMTINSLPKLPLPNIPSPIKPVSNKKITRRGGIYKKGGFKADVVDNLEDRDDDWMITKQ
jgi:hypothetical protein